MRMMSRAEIAGVTLLAVLASLAGASACGDGGNESTGVENLPAVSGETIGVVTLDGLASLVLRYVLQEGAGIDSRALGGEVRYSEASADSLPEMLRTGEVTAAVLPLPVAYSLRDEPAYRVRAHVAAAMAGLTGSPVPSTVLLVARDEGVRRNAQIAELRRMLARSASYFRSNQDSVLETVVREQSLDTDYAAWLSERQRIVLGDGSSTVREGLAALWGAAVVTGDLVEAPDVQSSFFVDERGDEDQARETVSIAVLDDALHRAALYAIENGIVGSDSVDLAVTYLTPSGLAQAVNADEYDAVEGSPMLVATGSRTRLDLVVLSGAVQDIDSTLLFDYVAAE